MFYETVVYHEKLYHTPTNALLTDSTGDFRWLSIAWLKYKQYFDNNNISGLADIKLIVEN